MGGPAGQAMAGLVLAMLLPHVVYKYLLLYNHKSNSLT